MFSLHKVPEICHLGAALKLMNLGSFLSMGDKHSFFISHLLIPYIKCHALMSILMTHKKMPTVPA